MKNSKVVRLVAGLLLLCILLTACAKGGEGAVPDEVRDIYTKFLEVCKTDLVAGTSYCFGVDDAHRKHCEDSDDFVSEYRIDDWKRLNNELWVVTTYLKVVNAEEGRTLTHFVGKVDGKYYVMLNSRVIPKELTDGIDLSEYNIPNAIYDDVVEDTHN